MKKVISALTPQTVLLFIVSVLFWHGSLQFIGTKYHVSTVIAWVFCIAFSVFSGISLKDDLDRLDEATTSKITPAASNEFGNSTLGESSPSLLEGQGLEKDAKEVGGENLVQLDRNGSQILDIKHAKIWLRFPDGQHLQIATKWLQEIIQKWISEG